jgi:hypothetical protein
MNNETPSDRETLQEDVLIGFRQLDAGDRVPAIEAYARVEAQIQQIEREKLP